MVLTNKDVADMYRNEGFNVVTCDPLTKAPHVAKGTKVCRNFTDTSKDLRIDSVETPIGIQPTEKTTNCISLDWDGKSEPPMALKRLCQWKRTYRVPVDDDPSRLIPIVSLHGILRISGKNSSSVIKALMRIAALRYRDVEVFYQNHLLIVAGKTTAKHLADVKGREKQLLPWVSNPDYSYKNPAVAEIKLEDLDWLEEFRDSATMDTSIIANTSDVDEATGVESIDRHSQIKAGIRSIISQGQRHDTILSRIAVTHANMPAEDRSDVAKVYTRICAACEFDVEDFPVFMKGGARHKELIDMIVYVQKNNVTPTQVHEVLLLDRVGNFAYVEGSDDQYNLWYYNGKKWTPDSDRIIFRYLISLCNKRFPPKSTHATEMKKVVSVSDEIKTVDESDPATIKERLRYLYDSNGFCVDLLDVNGAKNPKPVNPTKQFYRGYELALPLNNDWCTTKSDEADEAWQEFCKAVDSIYGKDNRDIILDTFSTIFIPDPMKNWLVKALVVVGSRDTFKSALPLLLYKMFSDYARCTVSISEITGTDAFALARTKNRMLNVSDEEIGRTQKDLSAFKRFIGGTLAPREMKKTETITATHLPQSLFSMNSMIQTSYNDEVESVIKRMQIIPSQESAKKGNWRHAEFYVNPVKTQYIMMKLIDRGIRIINGAVERHEQKESTGMLHYEALTTGNVIDILKELLVPAVNSAVSVSLLLKQVNKRSGVKRSKDFLLKVLGEMSYDIASKRATPDPSGIRGVYSTVSSDDNYCTRHEIILDVTLPDKVMQELFTGQECL